MAESLKQIKNRIRSIGNTRKVTHAMEMISIAKLRTIENSLPALKVYFSKIDNLMGVLLPRAADLKHPFVAEREKNGKAALCVITSDTGLCGSYNHNILRLADDFILKRGIEKTLLIAVGKKGANYFKKRGLPLKERFLELNGRYSDEISDNILKVLTGIYQSCEADEIYIAYTRFESLSKVRTAVEKILKIELPVADLRDDYIFEPEPAAIIDELMPVYLSCKMKSVLLNSFASENAGRMMAMGEATNNAGELLDTLVLSRNKLRQANITSEIMEIVSSAESLR